jgi:hypothetical protein
LFSVVLFTLKSIKIEFLPQLSIYLKDKTKPTSI